MAETANIAAMAEKISEELFDYFLWQKRPSSNQNWDCVKESHNKNTHPTDVAFQYKDPYTGIPVYWNVDLKSYGSDSISVNAISNALVNLSLAVGCCKVSSQWKEDFIGNISDFEIRGLLFIYNHDNSYTADFEATLTSVYDKVNSSEMKTLDDQRVYVIGPKVIKNAHSISTDITHRIAKERFKFDNYSFFYPDNIFTKSTNDGRQPLTIEALFSPWIILTYPVNQAKGYVFYYQGECASSDEFTYFIDALSHYQLFNDFVNGHVDLKFINTNTKAITHFNNAKEAFLRHFFSNPDNENYKKHPINFINASTITKTIEIFSETEIGMGIR